LDTVLFLFCRYDSSGLNEAGGAAGTSAQNASDFMHGWMS